MPNLSEISTGTKLLLGAGILLLIDSFLAWQEVEVLGIEVGSANAWHGLGILMGIALLALLAWVVIQVMNVKLNFDLPITEAWLTLGLGIAVFALALIKNLADDFSTWASYVGVVLAALVALGAWLRAQELGGVSFERTAAGTTTPDDADAKRTTEPDPMRPTDADTEPPPRPPSSSTDV
jgi:hypothetical protein